MAWHYVNPQRKSAVKLTKISQLGLPKRNLLQMLSAEVHFSEKILGLPLKLRDSGWIEQGA